MIPIYATVSFLSYVYYQHAIYFEVLRDCYEAFAIASFFTLMCHYIAPNLHEQKEYFRNIEVKNWLWPMNWVQKCTGGEYKGAFRKPISGLTWFNVGRLLAAYVNITLILYRSSGSPYSSIVSFESSLPSSPSSPKRTTATAKLRCTRNSHIYGSWYSRVFL